MKPNIKSFALLLVTVIITVCFAACGDSSTASQVSGKTYEFESCTKDGEDATKTITAMYSKQSFSFKDDGTCVQTIVWSDDFAEAMGSSDPVEQSGTYEEKDNTVKVTFSSDGESTELEFKIDEETLTVTEDGSVMIYKLKANS